MAFRENVLNLRDCSLQGNVICKQLDFGVGESSHVGSLYMVRIWIFNFSIQTSRVSKCHVLEQRADTSQMEPVPSSDLGLPCSEITRLIYFDRPHCPAGNNSITTAYGLSFFQKEFYGFKAPLLASYYSILESKCQCRCYSSIHHWSTKCKT